MKEKMYLPLGAVAVLLSSVVSADTLLWYRFDGTGDTVVNVANPGFMDGKLKSVESNWGSVSYVLGDDSAKFPVYGGNAFPDGFTLHDPIGGTNCIAPRKMSWTESVHAGLVVAQGASNLHAAKKSLTVEAFFRLKPDAVSRAQEMHPIVNCGWDNTYGYMFSIMRGKPFLRLNFRKNDGTLGNTGTGYYLGENESKHPLPSNFLSDGKWHHVAFTITEDGKLSIYLDYQVIKTGSLDKYDGLDFSTDDACNLFQVGATLHTNRRSLWGDIAELRVSDEALTPENFLRPVQNVDNLVDDDTFLYLPLGNSAWFARESQTGYTNNLEKTAPYIPLASSSCHPVWNYYSTPVVPTSPQADEDVASGRLRNGILSGSSLENAGSTRFVRIPNPDSTSKKFLGHAISVPTSDMIQTHDLTMEFFFRQPTKMDSNTNITATLVYSPWIKVCIYEADGKLITRPYYEDGGAKEKKYEDIKSNLRVDDGSWHHYAFVWEQSTSNAVVYLDYKCINSKVVTNGLQRTASGTVFNIGCEKALDNQPFGGFLDDFRITKRVLRPHEFLTSRMKQGPSDILFHARFEGDYSSGIGEDILSGGIARRINGNTSSVGAVPEFEAWYNNAKVFSDSGMTDSLANASRLRVQGGEVYWPQNSLIERNRITVEFFAAFNELRNGANIMRFSPGFNAYNPNPYGKPSIPIWGMYMQRLENGENDLKIVTMTYTNDTQRIALYCKQSPANADVGRHDYQTRAGALMGDGRWHHWAITFDVVGGSDTCYTLWCDYEAVFQKTVPGLLNIPLNGTVLEICGAANTTGLVDGRIDEIRITDGVLTPDRFMRRGYPGFMFICR